MLNENLVGLLECLQFPLMLQLLNLLILTRTNAIRDKLFCFRVTFTRLLERDGRILADGEYLGLAIEPVAVLPGLGARLTVAGFFIYQQVKASTIF